MSDMMLPQVPVAPAPAKAPSQPAKAAEPAAESQAEPGFSEVLQTRMQTEEGGEETAAAGAEAADVPVAGQAPVTAQNGKPLPATGNPVSTVLAALTTVTQEAESAADTAQQSAVELPPGIAMLFPADHPQPTAPGRLTAAPQPLAQGSAPQHRPLVKGAPQVLPEPAQATVAQAVRDALAEGAETVMQRPVIEGFAAQARAAATVQGRTFSLDTALERLAPTPTQSAQPTSAAPQVLQPALPQDPLVGTRPLLPATTLDAPFRQPGWDQALSERVMWVANQRFQGAEIKLNPPQLGPIEVRVQLQHEQAQISFTAQNASVREALEAALPRLREMFNANGFNLVDVNVSQHSFAEQQRQAQERGGDLRAGMGDEAEVETGIAMQRELARSGVAARGGVDLFA